MTHFETLLFNRDNRVATITLNRPDAANGMNLSLTQELRAVANLCASDKSLKAVILTGNGRFFCAGGDINAILSDESTPGKGVKKIADELHEALANFATMDIPLICAINGVAAGAGFSLAISGDVVIAADSAKFTMSYSKVGLSPDGAASHYLPRLIGLRKTQELMFTNRVLSAAEAADWGIITAVTDDSELMIEAQRFAQIFVEGAKGSNASIKRLLLESIDNDLQAQMNLESQIISINADSEDGQEGMHSFLAKRTPTFK